MRQFITIIALVILGFACSRNKDETKIISKKDFIDILVDIHVFDAYVTDHSINSYIEKVDSLTLYRSIFEKYDANIDMFQATMNYYSERPEKFGEIYDEVFGNINKLNQGLTEEMELFNQGGLIQVSDFKKYIIIRGDTVNYPEPFVYRISGPGTYLLSTQIRMLKDDLSEDPRVYTYFFKDSIDNNPEDRLVVVDFPIQKSNFSRDYQFICELKDKKYKYVSITIPKATPQDSVYNKNMQISTLRFNLVPEKKDKSKPQVADTALKRN